MNEVVVECSECGRITWWSWELGDKPLCRYCFDKVVENDVDEVFRERWRRYRELNRDKYLARNMRWTPSLGQNRGNVKVGSHSPQWVWC